MRRLLVAVLIKFNGRWVGVGTGAASTTVRDQILQHRIATARAGAAAGGRERSRIESVSERGRVIAIGRKLLPQRIQRLHKPRKRMGLL